MYRKDAEPSQALGIYRVSLVSRLSSVFRSLRRPVSLSGGLPFLLGCIFAHTRSTIQRKMDGS
jgi:hypothetical protein